MLIKKVKKNLLQQDTCSSEHRVCPMHLYEVGLS